MHSPIVLLPALVAGAQQRDLEPSAQPRHRSNSSGASSDGPVQVRSHGSGDVRTVHVAGELDVAGRAVLTRCCRAGTEPAVVVDISRLVFMDCGGYAPIAAAQHDLALVGRTLTLVGAVGQPARLLQLIAQI